MAKDKKSFVLYSDLLKSVDHLTNEELGLLFKHILEYVNDLEPVLEDRLLLTAWKPIERSLKEDLNKWEEIRVKRSQAGKKGGLAKQASARSAKQTLANQAVSVTVTDTVNVNVTSSSELLTLWVNYRKGIKKPITDYSINQLAKRIEREGLAKAKYIVELSIENGWQGLFWNKWEEDGKNKNELKHLDRQEALRALNIPAFKDKLLKDGYTLEQIQEYAN